MTAIATAPTLPESGYYLAPQRRFTFMRELLKRKVATIAIAYLVIFYGAGVLAPLVAPHDPTKQELSVQARYQGPTQEHLFGQDALGRDILSRVIYSARTTIIFTVSVIISGSVLIGLTLGLIAGYRGGWVDTVVLRIGEVLSGVPTIILILAITAAFRTRIDDLSFWMKENTFLDNDARTFVKMTIIIVASVPFGWIGSARIVRGQALSIREQDFVLAAEAMGASTWRIIWRHVFPGVLPLFLVGLSSGMAAIATLEVGLSYLGLGIDPPTASFGNLIADSAGVAFFAAHPHMLICTAAPLVLFIFAWNLLGDALVDMVQPRRRVR